MERLKARLRDRTQLPLLMGILNVTPDSFSDGGRFPSVDAAVEHARLMVIGGADLIDIGGESTRPGSLPISEAVQISRVVPVVKKIREELSIPISIDTTRAAVARSALDAGANIINDISAGRDDPAILQLAADRRVPVILMHMQGTPVSMQENPTYGDVVTEVRNFLLKRLSIARTIGIDHADVWLDPGIGFGKTVQHNLNLLGRLNEFSDLGCPVVVGTSRKRFISLVTGEANDRLLGTAATVAWAATNGAAIVRVHDVAEMARVTRMTRVLRESRADTDTAAGTGAAGGPGND